MQTQNSSNSLWKLFSWNSFSASEPDLRAGLFCRCHLRMAKKNATCPRQLRCNPLRSAASLCLCRFLCRFFSFRHLAEYHKDAIGLIMLQYKEQNITDPLNTFKKYLKSILKKEKHQISILFRTCQVVVILPLPVPLLLQPDVKGIGYDVLVILCHYTICKLLVSCIHIIYLIYHIYIYIYGVASKFGYGSARGDPDVWIGLDHLRFGMDRGYGSACGFRVWIGALHFDSQPYIIYIYIYIIILLHLYDYIYYYYIYYSELY